MEFLAPAAFWIAAGVVPALVILYFLKLRRREETVPSTLLWKKAVQDLQVNAPFQKLRRNLLLLLQLLVLLAGVFALARPIVRTETSREKSLILLIDNSASMNTREARPGGGVETRLAAAKEQALRLLKTVNRTGSSWFRFGGAPQQTRVMVISFADRARVVSPGFTTNTAELEELIRGIEPSDAATTLKEAIELADAYMAQTTVEVTPETSERASRLVLFSDGGIGDLSDLTLRNGTMEIVRLGETQDNVGITALRTQRNYERPEVLEAFVELRNYAPEPVTTDVSLFVDGALADAPVRTVALDAATPVTDGSASAAPGVAAASQPEAARDPDGAAPAQRWRPSAASLSFELELARAAVLEVRLAREDALPTDNRGWAIIPPPRKLSVLLVSKGNYFVESILNTDALPLQTVKYLTPEQYEAAAEGDLAAGGRSLFDVVIIDGHSTGRLYRGNYLFLNAIPQVEGVAIEGEIEGHNLIWWDETHPVLRYVSLEFVYIAKGLRLSLPAEAQTLIDGPAGPVLARYSRDGRQFMVLGFDVAKSNWVLKRGFPTFLYNAVRHLGAGDADVEQARLKPGEALRIPLPPGVAKAKLIRPDGGETPLTADEAGLAYFGGTRHAGVYRVEPGAEGQDRYAVNLEDDNESNIAPRGGLRIGAQTIAEGEAIRTATPEIWRWFVGAALAIVLLEWYIYNRRVMI